MNNILITLKKELRSILRDKRTLRLIFIYPIMIPIIIILYANMYNTMLTDDTTTFVGIDYNVNEIEKQLLKNNNIEYIYYETLEEMEEAYNNSKISAYINYEKINNKYQIYTDIESTEGSFAAQSIYMYLEEYNTYLTNNYLLEKNINLEEAYNHFTIEEVSISEDNYIIKILLSLAITYTILSICFATINMAIQATITEKENGTLETILTFPIKKTELIIGKYLSSVILGMITGLTSLILTIISFVYSTNKYVDLFNNTDFILNWKTILLSVIIIIITSILISGISLLLTAFTKTYKEAQSKSGIITMLTMIPMFTTLLEIELNAMYYLIPVINITQSINDLFLNNYNLLNIIITIISTIIYSIILVTIIIKLYNTDKILYSE
jgi:sodium transport system permease protein